MDFHKLGIDVKRANAAADAAMKKVREAENALCDNGIYIAAKENQAMHIIHNLPPLQFRRMGETKEHPWRICFYDGHRYVTVEQADRLQKILMARYLDRLLVAIEEKVKFLVFFSEDSQR